MTAAQPQSNGSVMRLAWPLILSFWMRSLFNFVDAGFAATIGDEAVAAIGLAYPLEFLLIACWVGTSTGMTSLLSRAMGAREGARVQQIIRTTWPLWDSCKIAQWSYSMQPALSNRGDFPFTDRLGVHICWVHAAWVMIRRRPSSTNTTAATTFRICSYAMDPAW